MIYDKEKFFYSVKRSIPILIGYFPVGMAYGILMANAGYQFGWSVIISMFVYTGSLQMLMVSFLVNQIPLMTVEVTALLVNSRHIFYGLSFIEKFREYRIWKYFLIYGLTDENYSLLCSYKETDGVNEKWVHIFSTILLWVYWITFSGIGGLVGEMIPFDTTGIDFALTALFVVIFVDMIRGTKAKLPALAAALSSVLWIVLVGTERFLLPSLLTTVAVLIFFKKRNGGKNIMLSMGYTICMIVVCAFCTFAERLLPFLIFRKGSVPNLVRYLGNILPVAVMATLVIYCLRAVDLSSWAGFMPQLIAVAVTAGLHFWKGNTLLSVTGGTVCYMVLIRSVF